MPVSPLVILLSAALIRGFTASSPHSSSPDSLFRKTCQINVLFISLMNSDESYFASLYRDIWYLLFTAEDQIIQVFLSFIGRSILALGVSCVCACVCV